MIANEKELEITQVWVERFTRRIEELGSPNDDVFRRAEVAGLMSVRDEMQEDIDVYVAAREPR